ncbi:MAG: hypothetical protein Q9219_003205 [cf. Caloplaca sp. 3 TL-2023]
MLPFSPIVIFVFSIFHQAFAQSIFQSPAAASEDLTVDTNIDQFAPVYGGVPNITLLEKPQCFTNLPGFPPYHQVGRADCYYIFFSILTLPTATTAFRWGNTRRATPPTVYAYGTCVVSVIAMNPTASDTFSQVGVARVAALVVQECVVAPKGYLGGRLPIGSGDNFVVAVGQR